MLFPFQPSRMMVRVTTLQVVQHYPQIMTAIWPSECISFGSPYPFALVTTSRIQNAIMFPWVPCLTSPNWRSNRPFSCYEIVRRMKAQLLQKRLMSLWKYKYHFEAHTLHMKWNINRRPFRTLSRGFPGTRAQYIYDFFRLDV